MEHWSFLWVLVTAGVFYFLLFAHTDIRSGFLTRLPLEPRYRGHALVIVIALAVFLVSYFGPSLVAGIMLLAGLAICALGVYLAWLRYVELREMGSLSHGAEPCHGGLPSRELSGQGLSPIVPDASRTPAALDSHEPQSVPPGEPRLGILHLMGLAACLALYFALERAVYGRFGVDFRTLFGIGDSVYLRVSGTLLWCMHSIFAAVALGGLCVLALRRWRGLSFPRHPGEYLWILAGMTLVIVFGRLILSTSTGSLLPWISGLGQLSSVLLSGLLGALWIWAIVETRRWRWRLFLGVAATAAILPAALYVLIAGTAATSPNGMLVRTLILYSAIDLSMIPVLYVDHRQGIPRPWTHWTGVLLRLADALMRVANVVIALFS